MKKIVSIFYIIFMYIGFHSEILLPSQSAAVPDDIQMHIQYFMGQGKLDFAPARNMVRKLHEIVRRTYGEGVQLTLNQMLQEMNNQKNIKEFNEAFQKAKAETAWTHYLNKIIEIHFSDFSEEGLNAKDTKAARELMLQNITADMTQNEIDSQLKKNKQEVDKVFAAGDHRASSSSSSLVSQAKLLNEGPRAQADSMAANNNQKAKIDHGGPAIEYDENEAKSAMTMSASSSAPSSSNSNSSNSENQRQDQHVSAAAAAAEQQQVNPTTSMASLKEEEDRKKKKNDDIAKKKAVQDELERCVVRVQAIEKKHKVEGFMHKAKKALSSLSSSSSQNYHSDYDNPDIFTTIKYLEQRIGSRASDGTVAYYTGYQLAARGEHPYVDFASRISSIASSFSSSIATTTSILNFPIKGKSLLIRAVAEITKAKNELSAQTSSSSSSAAHVAASSARHSATASSRGRGRGRGRQSRAQTTQYDSEAATEKRQKERDERKQRFAAQNAKNSQNNTASSSSTSSSAQLESSSSSVAHAAASHSKIELEEHNTSKQELHPFERLKQALEKLPDIQLRNLYPVQHPDCPGLTYPALMPIKPQSFIEIDPKEPLNTAKYRLCNDCNGSPFQEPTAQPKKNDSCIIM